MNPKAIALKIDRSAKAVEDARIVTETLKDAHDSTDRKVIALQAAVEQLITSQAELAELVKKAVSRPR